MVCRLCLKNLNESSAAPLFSGDHVESPLTKMIAKYFHLELTPDDAVSTQICHDCWTHLDDFHKFCTYVEQQQSSLRCNEFLEVKLDSASVLSAVPEPIAEVLMDHVGDDESLLDIKDVVMVNCNPQALEEEFGYASKSSSSTSTSAPRCAGAVAGEGAADQSSDADNDFDDDVPLINLRKNHKLLRTSSSTSQKKLKIRKTTACRTKKSMTAKKPAKKIKAECNTPKKEYENENTELSTKDEPVDDADEDDDDKAAVQKKVKTKKSTTTSTTTSLSKKSTSTASEEFEATDKLIANYMQLKCDICEISLETFTKLRKHFRTLHNMAGYVQCCDRRFTKRHVLVGHINFHLNPNFFQCKLCNKTLKSRSCLEVHMENNHANIEDLKFECTVCGKRFPRQQSLSHHSLKHQTERDFACTLCEKAFVSKYRLDMHIRAIHDNISPHVCDFCGRAFKFKPSFLQHVAEHKGIQKPPVQCHICGTWLKHKLCLRQHLARHNQLQLPCEHCGGIYPSRNALRAHILWKHERTAVFQCSFCDKSFKMEKNLKEHIAIHTGEKHHTCPHCPRDFRSKANMYVHIKRDHVEEWIQSKNANSKAPPDAIAEPLLTTTTTTV